MSRTLREELEQVIVTIQLRRADAKQAVDTLLAKRAAEETPPEEPVVRFQNAGAESNGLRVKSAFEVSGKQFAVKNHVVFRPNAEGSGIELENRDTGDRVIVEPEVFAKIQATHLTDEWPEGEFAF